jgi:hypothetical protein
VTGYFFQYDLDHELVQFACEQSLKNLLLPYNSCSSKLMKISRILFINLIWFSCYFVGAETNEVKIVNKHFTHQKKCQSCHQINLVQFQLLTGKSIDISEIPMLCGQCHGIVKRDWDQNIHGKKINSWKNEKSEKWSCLKCHDPHEPKFKVMQADPAPQKPKYLIKKGESHGK